MARTRLDKMIDAWDPILKKAFIESISNLSDRAQLDQLTKAIAEGNIENALRAIGLDPVAFRPFDKALSNAFEAGGNAISNGLPDVKLQDGFNVSFQFNVRNPVAEKWLSENSSTMVTEILNDQRNMIREYLQKAIADGDNPTTAALDLVGRIGESGKRENGTIGLTSSQMEWVNNYEAELRSDNPADALTRELRDRRFDPAVQRAIDSGQPIPDSTINSMVDSYQNRALRYRAETIARSEASAALHEAQDQAMQQALDTGAITPENVTYIWRATHDNRTRESHREMDGQEVAMGEKFISGNGNEIEYPGDPNAPAEEIINCRCWREVRVDFLAGIQ